MRLFGLIGYPLSHSFSKKYFTEKFAAGRINDCRYENFPLKDISQLSDLLKKEQQLAGLNVTIPYKEKVIPFLSEMSPVVSSILACNCIRISEGKLYGYNTDVTGFSYILNRQLKDRHQHALILGSGGASKAVEHVLNEKNISWKQVSRTKTADNFSYSELDDVVIKKFTLIINTSPVGMYPETDLAPPIPFESVTSDHLFIDLIYNPEKTKFLRLAEEKGAAIQNGGDMLIVQAEESWKIWNT